MKLSGAVFDFDGTLFDTMSVWDTAGEDYLKQCGKVPRENLCEVLKPKSLSGAAEYLKKNYDLPLSVNEIVDGVNKTVGDFYLCEAQPKNGVREFLTALREINVRMCITTAAERKLTEGALKRCGLFGFSKNNSLAEKSGTTKTTRTYIVRRCRFSAQKKMKLSSLRTHITPQRRQREQVFMWQRSMTAAKKLPKR